MNELYNYIQEKCPNLNKRMEKDAISGDFDWGWLISSGKGRRYMESLANRKILDSEIATDVWDEVEAKLH